MIVLSSHNGYTLHYCPTGYVYSYITLRVEWNSVAGPLNFFHSFISIPHTLDSLPHSTHTHQHTPHSKSKTKIPKKFIHSNNSPSTITNTNHQQIHRIEPSIIIKSPSPTLKKILQYSNSGHTHYAYDIRYPSSSLIRNLSVEMLTETELRRETVT